MKTSNRATLSVALRPEVIKALKERAVEEDLSVSRWLEKALLRLLNQPSTYPNPDKRRK